MDPTDYPEDYDEDDRFDPRRDFEDAASIDPTRLPQALGKLTLLGDDPFLRMQVTNIGLVDSFLNLLESRLMRELVTGDRTPPDTAFVLAQSQMWIFATYELLRTWKQRTKDTIKLIQNGGVAARLEKLQKPLGYRHTAREMRAHQLQTIAALPNALDVLDADLRRVHVTFGLMEALRMALAKHEVPKVKDSVAFAPGYGRINMWNGSIDFELSTEMGILDTVSHRNLADGLRVMFDSEPQTWDELRGFDDFLRGPPTMPEAPSGPIIVV